MSKGKLFLVETFIYVVLVGLFLLILLMGGKDADEISNSQVVQVTTKKAQTHPLYISTDPKGATVKVLNIKPKYYYGMKLKSGVYKLHVSKAGYQTVKKSITLPSAEKHTIRLSIVPTYKMVLVTTPKSAKVQILNIKPKYYHGIHLKRGTYKIRISKPGYKTINRYITLKADVSEHIVLQRKK